jgi:hypothetical protein
MLSTLVTVIVVVVAAWMCFDNVFSGNAATRELAEQAACATRSCHDQHTLTHERRMPWEQQFEYAWRDATVRVSCHRVYYVVGERRCTVEE